MLVRQVLTKTKIFDSHSKIYALAFLSKNHKV